MSHTQPSSLNSETSSRTSWWWVVAILYCLSGLTSLAYEVLWARMLSMQFGVSIFGVVLTVAAFMIGLGLGSLAGVRWAKQCNCLLYTSDAADDLLCVDLGGRRIIKKKKTRK